MLEQMTHHLEDLMAQIKELLGMVPGSLDVSGYGIPTWLCLTVPTAALIYGYLRYKADYMRRKGYPGPRGNIVMGPIYDMLTRGVIEFDEEMQTYGEVVGCPGMMGSTGMVNVYNLDMIKDILIKDFSSFTNHTDQGNVRSYPGRKMLTILRDDHWKHVRNTLSPTFSGGKLRRMTDAINKCCQTWNSHLSKKAESGEVMEMKKMCGFFTMDTLASTVFGIDVDSVNNPDNRFVRTGEIIMGVGKTFSFKLVLLFMMPNVAAKLGIKVFPPSVMEFFTDATKQALKFREENREESTKKDFLQLMVDADIGSDPTEEDMKQNDDLLKSEKGHIYSKKGLTTEEILGSAFFFFLAGFDTVAAGLSFLCYNLACHPDKQEKLYEEIDEVLGGKDPDYDLIKKMPYLQMCVDESLRLFPPAVKTERSCDKDAVVNGYKFEKGWMIGIPIWCIHRNPEIYQNPDEFIPERMSVEEKAARHPMAWLPFGQGPRACVAMRLALVEVKLGIINLLREFKLVTCDETQIPIKISKLKMEGIDGINLKVEKR